MNKKKNDVRLKEGKLTLTNVKYKINLSASKILCSKFNVTGVREPEIS